VLFWVLFLCLGCLVFCFCWLSLCVVQFALVSLGLRFFEWSLGGVKFGGLVFGVYCVCSVRSHMGCCCYGDM